MRAQTKALWLRYGSCWGNTATKREGETEKHNASMRCNDGKINALLDQKENCSWPWLSYSSEMANVARVLERYSRLTLVYEGILPSWRWILCHHPRRKEWKPVYESSQISRIYFLQGNTLLYNLGLYQWVACKFQIRTYYCKILVWKTFCWQFYEFHFGYPVSNF